MRIDPCEGPGDENVGWAKPTSVRDRMSRPAVTVSGRASLAEALRMMTDHRIHYLPVMDDEGYLVGMVNEDDVLGTRQGVTDPVAAVMSEPVVSVGPGTPLRDAMDLMVGRGIGVLPVVEGGRVVGILTQNDVATARARQ
jgi:CBS domain-containing protein